MNEFNGFRPGDVVAARSGHTGQVARLFTRRGRKVAELVQANGRTKQVAVSTLTHV